MYTYEGGTPPNGIIFWRTGPLWYRLPPLGEFSRNPSVSVHQLALWEAAFGISAFFLRLFHRVCPFHDGWFTSIPSHTALSVEQFLTKTSMIPMLLPPYSPSLAVSNYFCFPGGKKSSKGNILPVCKRWNKMAEALKGIKIDTFRSFWAVEKMFQ